jgi:hypothetical protein
MDHTSIDYKGGTFRAYYRSHGGQQRWIGPKRSTVGEAALDQAAFEKNNCQHGTAMALRMVQP